MLIAIYRRIPCKTKRWYQKIFWHLTDMAKVNSWILYQPHANQRQIPIRDQKTFWYFVLRYLKLLFMQTTHQRTNEVDPLREKVSSLLHVEKSPQFLYQLLIYVMTDQTTGQFPLHKKIVKMLQCYSHYQKYTIKIIKEVITKREGRFIYKGKCPTFIKVVC